MTKTTISDDDFKKLYNQVQSMGKTVQELEERIDKLEERADISEKRIEELEGRADALCNYQVGCQNQFKGCLI